VSCCKHGNEYLVSIKDEEFLEQLANYKLLKKGSAHTVNLIEVNGEGRDQIRTSLHGNKVQHEFGVMIIH
jgi:hypothetical protein